MCLLQHVAKASVGQYWTVVGKSMVPGVSNLVKTFMNATGTQIPPHVIRQCWHKEETPQDLGASMELLYISWMK